MKKILLKGEEADIWCAKINKKNIFKRIYYFLKYLPCIIINYWKEQ